MAKGKGKVTRYKEPQEKFVVVQSPWGMRQSLERDQGSANNVEGWFRIMMRDLLDLDEDLYAYSVFTVKTQDHIIVELPKEVNVNKLLGVHMWSQFLTAPYANANIEKVSVVYEYDYVRYDHPTRKGWSEWTPRCDPLPSNFPIKSPYPEPKLPLFAPPSQFLPVRRLPVEPTSGVYYSPTISSTSHTNLSLPIIASTSTTISTRITDIPGPLSSSMRRVGQEQQPRDRVIKLEEHDAKSSAILKQPIKHEGPTVDPRLRDLAVRVKSEPASDEFPKELSARSPRRDLSVQGHVRVKIEVKEEPLDRLIAAVEDFQATQDQSIVKPEPGVKEEDVARELAAAVAEYEATQRRVRKHQDDLQSTFTNGNATRLKRSKPEDLGDSVDSRSYKKVKTEPEY